MTPAPEAVDEVEDLAVDGLRWLTGPARETPGGGLAWTTKLSDDRLSPTLHTSTAGVVPVLLDAWRHFGDDSYADTALRAARSLADSCVSYACAATRPPPTTRSLAGPPASSR
ncbi:hypothetical protein AB0M11_02505 [Streptomyces sp. NPDC051987]|uniref:hypothetical protein n=1 Tax=Streptomyces sp. NPDC051987 TaxID=3155808 RepID=UPI00341C6BF3